MDRSKGESLKIGFDGGIKIEFHSVKVTSDSGLLVYRDLDDALGLFHQVSTVINDLRTGRNIQHDMPTLLRQLIYSCVFRLHPAPRYEIIRHFLRVKNNRCRTA